MVCPGEILSRWSKPLKTIVLIIPIGSIHLKEFQYVWILRRNRIELWVSSGCMIMIMMDEGDGNEEVIGS